MRSRVSTAQGACQIMSCWVVPSVAAELWGCSVDSIMSAIRDGRLSSRVENGWTFVDMVPDSVKIEAPKAVRPATYEIVSAAEMAALAIASDDELGDEYTEPEPDVEVESSESMGDWREARR